MPSRYSPTSPKALRFVDEYLVDLNGAAAARRAGYSEKRANKVGSSLLALPEIQAKIEAAKAKRAERTEVTADRVLAELALIAFSDIDHYTIDAETGRVTLAEGAPKGAKRAISSVKYRVSTTKSGVTTRETELRLWSKDTAIGNAMKHLGLLRDKLEVTGKDGGPIEVDAASVRAAIVQRLERLAPGVPCG